MAEHTTGHTSEGGDSDASDDFDAVANRLEAALERIARQLESPAPGGNMPELAARLDGLIERLRDILGSPNPAPPHLGPSDDDTTG